jgi:lipoyl(octanoyl) transferase
VSAPVSFSILVDPPLDGARNMARDHALAASLPPGRAILRLYGWGSPTISFGRNEPAAEYAHLPGQRIDGRELAFVRRPTGGRAVLHDDELTYAVVLGVRSLGGVRKAYAAVNRALLLGMASLGVSAEVARGRYGRRASDSSPSLRPDAGPCFQHASPGEITVCGRKLVGSAQVRIGGAILQHGSILISRRARANPELEPLLAGATSLEELLGRRPSRDELIDACTRAFHAELAGAWPVVPPCDENFTGDARADRSEQPLRAHYASDEWTWRGARAAVAGSVT